MVRDGELVFVEKQIVHSGLPLLAQVLLTNDRELEIGLLRLQLAQLHTPHTQAHGLDEAEPLADLLLDDFLQPLLALRAHLKEVAPPAPPLLHLLRRLDHGHRCRLDHGVCLLSANALGHIIGPLERVHFAYVHVVVAAELALWLFKIMITFIIHF